MRITEYVLLALVAVLFGLVIFLCVRVRSLKRMLRFLAQEEKKKKSAENVTWNEEEMQELGLLRKRMELSVLQEQINPHFLYNTLDSIRSRALMDDQLEIAKMTESLSRFFRYCISRQENLVKVREELEHIEDHYYIQKYRFEDRIELEIHMESEELYDLYLPKMTLQPLVENAMIHGLEKRAENGKIDIHLFRADERLVILISDNGVGMDRRHLDQLNARMQEPYFDADRKHGRHSGIAPNNVNARLKMTFGEDSGIHYRSMEGEGTDAVVMLPVVDVFSRVAYEEKSEL